MADGSKQTNRRFNASICSDSTIKRMVAVRYYLDRPGYDLQHSSARFWRDPPATCNASNAANFLEEQGIKDDSIVVEIYLDKFGSYMLLEACEADRVEFDFSSTSVEEPGILNIRLTDTSSEGNGGGGNQAFTVPHYCNTSPVGLFAFSMAIAMQTTSLLGTLVPNSVGASFVLTYGPYGFWLCGLLQLIVGMNEVRRNNIYGATAFMTFGSFWLANGTSLIIESYFPSEIPDELLVPDSVGNFIINFYVFGFVCVLLKQTLVMNKVTTTLIALLAVLIFSTSLTGWTVVFEWIQLIFGWIVSLVAFYLFTAEFTNEVYQREVFDMHPWTIDSSEEVFGAAGRANTLQSKATKLRLAHIINAKSVHGIRTALPESKKEE